jgi:guanylate kinase
VAQHPGPARQGHLFLLIGPSGSGKTTLIREIRRHCPDVVFVPTTTTRPPRPTEANGREYYFVSDAEFDAMLAAGEFFEWQEIHGFRYGTSRSRILEALRRGSLGILSIDILGGMRLKEELPDHVTTIFVRPSSLAALKERLLARGDTDDIARRLQRVQMELDLAGRCDYLLVNDDLEAAVGALRRILEAHRSGRRP